MGGVGSKAGEEVRKGLNEGASTVADSVAILGQQHRYAVEKLGLNAVDAARILGDDHKQAALLIVNYGREVALLAESCAHELQVQLQGMTQQVTDGVRELATAHSHINRTLVTAINTYNATANRALDQVDVALTQFQNSFQSATDTVNNSTTAFRQSMTTLAISAVLAAHVQSAPAWVLVAAVLCGFQAVTTSQPFDDVVGDVFHRLASLAYSIGLSFLCWMALIALVSICFYSGHAYYSSLRADVMSLQLQRDLNHKRMKLEADLKKKQKIVSQLVMDSVFDRLTRLEERPLPAAAPAVQPPVTRPVLNSLFDGFSFRAENVIINVNRMPIVFPTGRDRLNLSTIRPTTAGSFQVPSGKGGAWLLMVSGKISTIPFAARADGSRYEVWLIVDSIRSVMGRSEYPLGGGTIFRDDAGLPLLGHILHLHEQDIVTVQVYSDYFIAPDTTKLWYVLFQGEFRGAVQVC